MPPGSPNPTPSRSAQEVIDTAIRESKVWEWVCLGLTVSFAVAGIALLIIGAARADWGVAGPGVGAMAMFAPTLWAAAWIRHTNIRVRLLEIPLHKAKTAEEAARIIDSLFRSRRGNSHATP